MSNFVKRKWTEVNALSGGQYSVNKNIRSDLRDCSNAYSVVKKAIIVEGIDDANKRNKYLTFKNNAPFISFTSEINNAFIVNAEDLDIVLLMYNLLEYSDNDIRTFVGKL